ncbi:hypothetical protein HK102_014179, partial [Quaeritorhiza haematococci]
MASKFGGAPKCPRCGKSVYAAEKVPGPAGDYHKSCLTCKECNKRLDSTTLTERDKEAYCKSCYGKLFGPKGYGFGGGAAFLSTDSTVNTSKSNSPTGSSSNIAASSSGTSLSAAAGNSIASLSVTTPRSFGSTTAASPTLTSKVTTTAYKDDSAPVVPSYITALNDNPKPRSSVTSSSNVAGNKKVFGGSSDLCPRCNKAVYFAEQVTGPGSTKYHKACFKCSDCGKSLDSSNVADKDGVVYCRPCHAKKFGPKGYGFGGGAAFLTTEGKA